MKLAIIFDDLVQFGGAEKLLLATHEIWPGAPVYTSFASNNWQEVCIQEGINLKTSFMQKLPFRVELNRFFAPSFLYVVAFESFDLSDYDVVLSISSRFAHGVVTKPSTKHICYMNSPGRMIWETYEYFKYEKHGHILRKVLHIPLSILRVWDYSAAQRVDYFVSNSKTPQSRIKKYYGRDSKIIYPFVDNFNGYKKSVAKSGIKKSNKKDYYLIISRLVSWKRLDIAIRAANELEVTLKIAGSGPDLSGLKNISSGNIEFLGYVSDEEKSELLANCAALINPQHEDFGIAPLEAMAHGRPVIAYGAGGVLETIISGKTGEYFDEQSVESLVKTLKKFDKNAYSSKKSIGQAMKFSKRRFKSELKKFVDNVYLKSVV